MLKLGFVGARGMVGSVLIERMKQEHDFDKVNTYFFSTSNINGVAPSVTNGFPVLLDAYDIDKLLDLDCIITTQGSEYTERVLPLLKSAGYAGYWIDASSHLRMDQESVIVLDPINNHVIEKSLKSGIKNFIGGNCTVSLMLLAIDGLLKNNLVEWVSSMTYQAVSGAGASNMREFLQQSNHLNNYLSDVLANPDTNILEIEKAVTHELLSNKTPTKHFKAPLFCNLLPWIDKIMSNGQTREEWKATAEANKILGYNDETIKVDGLCVRVGSLRCHSQALTIKLTDKNLKIDEITQLITNANQWVRYVPNLEIESKTHLTPLSISGSLDIAVGRIRKMNFGEEYLTLFTVGDQLLWGAAEPLRRMLNILINYKK